MTRRSAQPDAPHNSTSYWKYVHQIFAAAWRALRIAVWNAALIIAGLLLIALAMDAYFRLTKPFLTNSVPFPHQFVDGVGQIRKPNAEIRYGSWGNDFLAISYTNSQGFVDREPISPARAAYGCHIAFIGDSFVEGLEVPISDKFHVRLEEMAARELPHLDITTQAYGIRGTAQINQLPFYDKYARHLNPKLVTLVFYLNDFRDNSAPLQSLKWRVDPDRMPFVSAQKDARGDIKLRPPDPEFQQFTLPRLPEQWYGRAWRRLVRVSHFAKWLDTSPATSAILSRIGAAPPDQYDQYAAWANIIAERPCCASLLDGWQPTIRDHLAGPLVWQFLEEHLPPAFEEALEYTAFGIDQFKRRADRDGAKLAILAATDEMGTQGDPQFDRLSAIAETRGIPIISQYDHVVSQGYDYRDGRWAADPHWNATGHQWAAEAVLEWLKVNQDVCD